MAKASGTDLAGFDAQLKTTKMFYTPKEALDFTNSAEVPKISDLVRTFSFDHALLGDNVKSKDAIGIAMPDGKVQGAAANVKLRYDTTFMKMALDNKL
jgi:NitT/TauT family transport system substrate-binding protein